MKEDLGLVYEIADQDASVCGEVASLFMKSWRQVKWNMNRNAVLVVAILIPNRSA